jgi:tRNA 2-selenouridine synthase
LALIGVHVLRVTGGYRVYRHEVVDFLERWRPPVPVITLYGPTGVGKSALIRALEEIGRTRPAPRPWALDLERMALHRGSLLGGLNQPAERRQKDFDALLLEELRRPVGDYLVIEGEGGRIGGIHLPVSVADSIRGGLPVLVSGPLEQRSQRIIEEYAPKGWDEVDVARFRRSLGLIGGRLARDTLVSLESAFDDGRFTDVVTGLLVGYYDPLHSKSCVVGRAFVLEFQTSSDPIQDALRFADAAARLIEEVPLSSRAPDR